MINIKLYLNLKKQKFNSMSPAAKASLALVLAKFFQKGMSLITGPIFTRIMPTSEYGIISTFTSWQSVLYIIATLNMASGVFNNGMMDFKEDRESFTKSLLCLANLCTAVCIGIYFLFYRWLAAFIDMPIIMMMIMAMYFIFTPAYNYWLGRQRFEFKYIPITIAMIAVSLLSTILAISFVLLAPNDSKAIAKVLGTETVAILIGIVFYIYTWVKGGKVKISYWKYAFSFNLPLIPHYLSMYVLSSSDRIMICKMVDTSATAIYNVAYTVAALLIVFWDSIDASYAPWIYQKLEEKKYYVINKRGIQILLFFAFASVSTNLFAPEIISILAPKSYHSGMYVIPSVSAGVFFTAVYSLYMRVELYIKKTKIVMIGTMAAAGLNLLLNYLLIPKFGFIAAGYTTLVCYLLLAIFHCVNVCHLGYGMCYQTKAVALISGLVIISCPLMSLLYSWTLLRYCFIFVLFITVVVKRRFFLTVIKKQ